MTSAGNIPVPASAVKKEHYIPRYYSLDILPEHSFWLVDERLKKFREDYGIKEYPINSFQLAQKISAIGRIRLDTVMIDGLNDKVDACAQYIPEIEQYYIFINRRNCRSFKTSKGRRCNFTMAHEIGHIVLGHLLIPMELKSKARLDIEEEEANLFAGQLLMPENLFLKSNFPNRWEVGTAFLVSDQCVFKRLNNLKRIDLLGSVQAPYCSVCGNSGISPVAEYCVICGTAFHGKMKKGIRKIEYPVPLADDRQRTIFCRECGNEEFSLNAEFCRICGLPLYNKCVGGKGVIGCGHANPLHARFCEICGAQTEYKLLGRLREWKIERDEYIAAMTYK